jgi:hypothetical protein
MFYNLLDLIS